MSHAESGPWIPVLDTELEDSRQQQDPQPLQLISLKDRNIMAQFIQFELLSWWGKGGGLEYFDIHKVKGNNWFE